jgi:hypothetical protein
MPKRHVIECTVPWQFLYFSLWQHRVPPPTLTYATVKLASDWPDDGLKLWSFRYCPHVRQETIGTQRTEEYLRNKYGKLQIGHLTSSEST